MGGNLNVDCVIGAMSVIEAECELPVSTTSLALSSRK